MPWSGRVQVGLMHVQGHTQRMRNSYGETETIPYGPVTAVDFVRPEKDPVIHTVVCAYKGCGKAAKVSVKSGHAVSQMHGRYTIAVLVMVALVAASAYSCHATMDGGQLFGWFACIAFVVAIMAVFVAVAGHHYSGVDVVEVPKGHEVETISV